MGGILNLLRGQMKDKFSLMRIKSNRQVGGNDTLIRRIAGNSRIVVGATQPPGTFGYQADQADWL